MKISLMILIFAVGLLNPLGISTVSADDITRAVDLDSAAGEFPEGLAVDKDGNLYFGLAPTGEIRKFTPGGEASTFANLPSPGAGFMLGMTFSEAGDLFVCMATFDPETHAWTTPLASCAR